MKKSSTTILVALSLLIGAGGVVVWKQQQDTDDRPSPPESISPNYSSKSGYSNSSAPKPSSPQKIKWSSITDDTLSRETRLNLARQIDRDLTPDEIEILLASLHRKPSEHRKEEWWVVMNEIMEQMRKKGIAPQRLANELITLTKDSSQSEIVRDYAVQHLSLWAVPDTVNQAATSSPDLVSEALIAIAATITDPSIAHTSIPGTAIMALTATTSQLPPELITPIWEKLDPAMTAMLKGEVNVPLSTRTTIIQSVALRGSVTHLSLIQQFARSEKSDPSMRLSSIAALGIYGSEDDRPYLTSIAQGQTRFRYAAQSALKKISH